MEKRMAESTRSKVSRNKKDIIIKLPGNIHEKILGLLPVQDAWIPVFSRNSIKQLTLEDFNLGEFTALHFSSLDLTHLRPISFWFSYTSASGGFTFLTNLELIDFEISKQCIFDCRVLEKLTLVTCTGLSHTNFHAPNLKCLHQMCYQISLLGFEDLGLENLKEFSCGLCYCYVEPSETSNLVKVFRSLYRTEKIYIAMNFIRYLAAGGSPNKLSKPLPYLKTLDISEVNFLELNEITCLLCLVRSAPNLCKLNISAEMYIDLSIYDDHLENYWVEDFEGFSIDRLEIVTFSYFRGLRAELELVKFLLAHAPLLKTMFIHRSKAVKKDVSLMIAEEMLQYTRASSRAQIRYLEQPAAINVFESFSDYVKIFCSQLLAQSSLGLT
ncbi:FBD domain-containing protein [Heracleum sosnowskyi]|uniref:FBD domain-containing protein n=1 Tax=Heracleum sosnowskyi TaxID=360622 RepID=A0AAD8GWS8_9APIA|nr:FBD domain-containing protein [Heracleum sosnowskyi]